MKKYLEFVIDKIDNNRYYLITITSKGLLDYQWKIERYLSKQNFTGNLYVDQVSVTADGYNRFAIIPFKNGKLDFMETEHIRLGDEYKQLTSNLFYNNPELIESHSFIPRVIREKFAKNEPA